MTEYVHAGAPISPSSMQGRFFDPLQTSERHTLRERHKIHHAAEEMPDIRNSFPFCWPGKEAFHLLSCKTRHQRQGVPVYFRRNEQPSVSLALPPVGWHRTVEQPAQMTTVWACEKTVVIVKQPGHLTSMKNDRGPGTRVWRKR